MHPDRAILVRLAYQRALEAARVAPTPRRWRKLVAAAKNLRASNRERELAWLARLPAPARRLAIARREAPRRGAVLLPFPAPRREIAWREIVAEWERARSLMEWSARLVAESEGLRVELAGPQGGGARSTRGASPGGPRSSRADGTAR